MRERFAKGFNLYKVFWIFMVGGVLGCIVETIWCYFAFGELSSRTSNVFLPFSTVWGLGCALFSVFLHNSKDSRTWVVFIKGYLLGGVFEFLCGWVCQIALGVTFWDYTGLPLSIGNYVNLIFCAFWGLVAIAWVKWVYPFFTRMIEKIPKKTGVILTWIMVCFMIVTASISGTALLRMSARSANKPPRNVVERSLDKYYPDTVLMKYFPKMKPV
ncbi:putative ABC transporter permease [Murimonas intestini]|uniref:ABC transporter type IV n=1 Tax=Murimonas intestini TaxID=1337051 RepID=A0AB73T9F5_9FIRM|nr:putative ABC transporter permease [Murimonas intestini]MCR1839329.1 putative ABC transporter permease [Murimonas intestini]MCR1864624.1 putative ABC transporter permease [Murimonas intestini]MCR1882234.1 putative ABC transporter permease [Murimonas intestini]